MNDQHPHAGYAAHDGYSTGSFDSDPLFGALPGTSPAGTVTYETDHSGQYESAQWNAGYEGYDPYATQAPQAPQAQYEAYDAYAAQPQQSYDTTGQWDANAWNEANQAATYGYDATGQGAPADQWAEPVADTGAYDATAWNSGAPAVQPDVPFQTEAPAADQYYGDTTTYESHDAASYEPAAHEPAAYDAVAEHQHEPAYDQAEFTPDEYARPEYDSGHEHEYDTPGPEPEQVSESEPAPEWEHSEHAEHPHVDHLVGAAATVTAATISPRPVRRAAGGSRGRRRTPAKRSAMLTVAVPSACVMGVAGIAAASVGGLGAEETKADSTTVTASEATAVKPAAVNNKLDTQLAALDADARDFGDRASRTQERIDLKERQAAEKKKREAEAAAREAARPKFAIPVANHALSAYYGQAGVNWMSMHTGIDFPVSYGTPVMAATDGTVRTQWNDAYGNMAIVTAADGTETWYCHLSSTKIRSGTVKAGDEIAYSGNSGNSTGPHLHFEVRPGGGAAIDPLAWFRSHGLSLS
ncbi:peptidoglycan DD-metalloendopeptidase family protein [Streptomyces sp. NBC_00838]|uniref:peptidoglycan DD-metalloendopeptidase family protein n=1 Tax=Streptomyces sp. NBC_00838 TaxID=2903680 RepID=UPI00386A60D3|nr:peptidoglycan DD-metalloendopeptidase family protein [Streptomyces sp. NBC_00838]